MWPLLHGTGDGTPTPIRGFASVLCRPATLGGVCTQLRLFARGLPRIVSLLSPRRVVGVLRRHTSGSARATQEEPRPRTDHRATQAQLLGLRDQPSAQGAGNAAKRTAVREVLAEEGFAPLPRRLDEERPVRIGPNAQAVANVGDFVLSPCEFTTRTGGLFLFIADLVRLDGDALAKGAKLPG